MTDGAPRLEHTIEQMGAAMRVMAKILHDYHASLVEHGFTREEALALVVGYQQHFLNGINKGAKQ